MLTPLRRATAFTLLLCCSLTARAGDDSQTYLPVISDKPFKDVMAEDKAAKSKIMKTQSGLLEKRYDLRDRPLGQAKMSGGRKAVQDGVRVKLSDGMTWDRLTQMTPQEIRDQGVFPAGFLPLPHVKHAAGGMVFPKNEIKAIKDLEGRSLERFDVEFDLPEQFTPEFPPPIFLTTRPELGDVSQGKLLSIDNYFDLMLGILDPGSDRGLAAVADPVSSTTIQSDRRPKSRKTEPGRRLSGLPCQWPHQCRLSSQPGQPAARGPLSHRDTQFARHVQSADPRLQTLNTLSGGLHRV